MSGERGDFSRIRYNRNRHYVAVLQQQGRVALDADANEQCAIDEHLRNTSLTDLIGPFGGPANDAGFAITCDGKSSLTIGPGRYYVDGILCENDRTLAYGQQPFLSLPNPDSAVADLLGELANNPNSALRVYLEVWERLVTPLDDPCLWEPALGQADTTVRRQTVWRVVAELYPPAKTVTAQSPTKGNVFTLNPNFELTKLEKMIQLLPAGETITVLQPKRVTDCCAEMCQPLDVTSRPGTLTAQTGDATADCSCEPTPPAGYRGLENQLYRIEIHQAGDATTATFKWSRENGSIVAAIKKISGSRLDVSSLGPDANLGFQGNNWVELTDDHLQFGQPPNQPGPLFQVQQPVPATTSLLLTQTVTGIDPNSNARVRRWDQFGDTATPNGIPVAAAFDAPFTLENGIQVQFSQGDYRSGDFWLITARTAKGEIEWPPCGCTDLAQPPHRLKIYRAPLACIHPQTRLRSVPVEDCRRFFPPATLPRAIHVTAIDWPNDGLVFLTVNANQNEAPPLVLRLALDQTLDSSVNGGNFIVTAEGLLNEKLDGNSLTFPSPPLSRLSVILEGRLTVLGRIITWVCPEAVILRAFRILNQDNAEILPGFTRIRVRILGHTVFKAIAPRCTIYLDGQTFATTAAAAGFEPSRLDLQLPSGGGARASDFESWFYLMPPARLRLVVDPSSFDLSQVQNPTSTGTVTLNYDVPGNTTVRLAIVASAKNIVQIPTKVVIAKGAKSATFTAKITGSPATTTSYTITASVTVGTGNKLAASQDLTVIPAPPPPK